MNEYDSECARLHAKLPGYSRRISEANRIIRGSLEQIDSPYVACSFGKDSAVLLHLVLQFLPGVRVRFLRWSGETELINNFDSVIQQWVDRYNINLEQVELSRETLTAGKGRWSSIQHDADGYFVGLRADESRARKITLKSAGVIYKMKSGLVRVSPLAWWKTMDVAAYVLEHSLPLPDSYSAEGIGSRTSARIPRENWGIRDQFFIDLRQRDPAAASILVERFPELEAYL